MELLSWKKVIDITKDGGVIKKTLNESTDYKTATVESTVKVRCVSLAALWGCILGALQHTTGLQKVACLGGSITLVHLRVTGWLTSTAGLRGIHALRFYVPACFCLILGDALWTPHFRLQCNVSLDLLTGALAAQLRNLDWSLHHVQQVCDSLQSQIDQLCIS